MDEATKSFYQGWAVCASYVAGPYDMPSLIEQAIKEHGVVLKILTEATTRKYCVRCLGSGKPGPDSEYLYGP